MKARALETAWALLIDDATASPADAVAADDALLERAGMLDGAGGTRATPPVLRLWTNAPCVVAGRFDARLPNLPAGRAALARYGVPLVLRRSGGTAVWHGPGVLNVSVVVPAELAPRGVHESFEALTQGMRRGLARLGLPVSFGRVPGTYCDGPHNLVLDGRKVAGLAQARRRGGVLVHASVLVDVALDRMHDCLEMFYAAAGAPQRLWRAGVTSLRTRHTALEMDALRGALIAGYEAEGVRFQAPPAPRCSG
jgi:lipoate-protein ligase A